MSLIPYYFNFCKSISWFTVSKTLAKSRKLCETFTENNDPEKFFEQFFCNTTSKSIQFLNDLGLASATTIMGKLFFRI